MNLKIKAGMMHIQLHDKRNNIIAVIVLVMLFIGAIVLLIQFGPEVANIQGGKREGYTELTEIDMRVVNELHANELTILGIKLGDTAEDVKKRKGNPDKIGQKNDGSERWEFGASIGLEKTGMILTVKDGKVARIMLLPSFNKLLKGDPLLGVMTKNEMYAWLGAPEEFFFRQVSSSSARVYREYQYQEKGFIINILSGDVVSVGFTSYFDGKSDLTSGVQVTS